MRLSTPSPAPAPTPTAIPIVTATPLRTIAAAAPPGGTARAHVIAASRRAEVMPVARKFPAQPVIVAAAGDGVNAGTKAATGAGTVTGSAGGSNDGARGVEPCGFVTFSDPHGSQYDAGTRGFWVDIRMKVHLADGSTQSLILDYPWYYASESANPWSDQNLKDPNFPTRFQPPPPSKVAGEPPLVQYVIAHSTPDGMTLLRDCPTPAPSSG